MAGKRAGQRRFCHVPRVYDFGLEFDVVGQCDRLDAMLPVPEIDQVILALDTPADVASTQRPAVGWSGVHNALEKFQTRRTLAVQDTAFGPPQDVLGIKIRFSVAAIGAFDKRLPGIPHELLGGDVAPTFGNVAFIPALVKNERLLETREILGRVLWIVILKADVRDPRARGVENPFLLVN